MTKDQKADTALTINNPKYLKEISHMGMSKVDPEDIRPSQILLAQKSSDFSMMVNKKGVVARPGEFFHTGKREIYKSFPCYFLFAAKGTYVDTRTEGQEGVLKPQYATIGALNADLSLFGMIFRSSALWALSSLFSAVSSQHAPMFAFICTLESKLIEGKKGSWFVPVCRVGEIEGNQERFDELYKMADGFEKQADKTAQTLNMGEEEEKK